jgi:hypothetical protein
MVNCFVKRFELPYLDNQRRISCIPAGQYFVRLRYPRESATRNYLHLLVQNVTDRDYILFHIGNKTRGYQRLYSSRFKAPTRLC